VLTKEDYTVKWAQTGRSTEERFIIKVQISISHRKEVI
jgi:hypothetical protein